MYKINFDKYFELLSWNIVFWGIKNDIIEAESAICYANKLVENNFVENDSLFIELFILENVKKNEVLSLISNMTSLNSSDKDTSLKILRYIILDNIRQSKQDNKSVLNSIENVYADFDYPEDMSLFISYMPIENDEYNPTIHTQEENEQRLINNFEMFLKKELQSIRKIIGNTRKNGTTTKGVVR